MKYKIRAGIVGLLTIFSLTAVGLPAQAVPTPGPATPAGVQVSKPMVAKKTSGKVYKGFPRAAGVSPNTTINCGAAPCYQYSGARQTGITGATGAQITMQVGAPTKLPYDYHSVREIAVHDNNGNVVEFGTTVDPALNGGSNAPFWFVYYWVNGVGQGYNTNFSLAVGNPITPGTSAAGLVGSNITARWDYFGAGCGCTQGWWLSYNGVYVGVFQDTYWPAGVFTTPDNVQVYDEAVVGYKPSRTQLGSGVFATATTGAAWSGFAFVGPTPPAPNLVTFNDMPDRWPSVSTGPTSFRSGGPGGTETITGSPSPADDCSGVGPSPTAPSGWGTFCTYNTEAEDVPAGYDPGLITDVVGALERYAYTDQGYGYQAYIHAPVEVAAFAFEAGLVMLDGPRKVTPMGSIWAFGAYPGGSVIISGQTTIWRAPEIQVNNSFENATNEVLLVAERAYSVAFDCFAGRAEFDPLEVTSP